MKIRFLMLCILFLAVPSALFALDNNTFSNRIEGQVFSPERLPLQNIYVELINEVDSVFGQTRTNSSGRFSFLGMPGGRYIIKVLTYGTKFKEQSVEVYVQSPVRGGTDMVYSDVYLTYDKRAADTALSQSPEAVFVQEIPPDAKKLYEDGVKDLKKNSDQGLAKIDQALTIFPTYYEALKAAGEEYFLRKEYGKSYPYFIKAIDINPRSSVSFYRLSYAFYNLKQYPAALEAARATAILAPDSVDALLIYGTLLNISEKYPEAEKILTKANTTAQGKNSEVHWQLASLYIKLKKNQNAIDELESFLKADPNSPDKNRIHDLIGKLKAQANNSKTSQEKQ